jgi:hypothetical protein
VRIVGRGPCGRARSIVVQQAAAKVALERRLYGTKTAPYILPVPSGPVVCPLTLAAGQHGVMVGSSHRSFPAFVRSRQMIVFLRIIALHPLLHNPCLVRLIMHVCRTLFPSTILAPKPGGHRFFANSVVASHGHIPV